MSSATHRAYGRRRAVIWLTWRTIAPQPSSGEQCARAYCRQGSGVSTRRPASACDTGSSATGTTGVVLAVQISG